MSERMNIPFTNEHFAAWCEKMLGQPYWYGSCAYKATAALLNRKSRQYPSHYGSARTARYQQDIRNRAVVCDCIGGLKGYCWTGGGQSALEAIGTDKAVASRYGANGCPDKGANGMFSYAKSKGMAWGTIDTLPDVIGLALYRDGHVGYTAGGGYAVEWRGFAYGCVKTRIAERDWTHWYQIPFLDYGNAGFDSPSGSVFTQAALGSRLLQNGSRGTDVQSLQEQLMKLGYPLTKYGADGKFGTETEKAVKAFQRKAGLTVDGKYGSLTHDALMDAVSDEEASDTEQPPVDNEKKVAIISSGGRVNIRCGNGERYGRITQASAGQRFPYVATAENGWHALEIAGKVGWVSGAFSQVEG